MKKQMSKLYDNYLYLKETDDKTLYLFKSGIFFIFLADDAKIASKLLNLKITYFTEDVIKCGFPVSSLEKYTNILKRSSYNFKIVDNIKNTIYSIHNYEIDEDIDKLLSKLSTVDTNSLSVKEAYNFIDSLKESAKFIMERDKNNGN